MFSAAVVFVAIIYSASAALLSDSFLRLFARYLLAIKQMYGYVSRGYIMYMSVVINIHLTNTTAAQNEDALSYHRVCGL